jgi:hypothetical protein
MNLSRLRIVASISLTVFCLTGSTNAEQIPVRYPQGSIHGYLALKTLDGVSIATGEVTQTVRGSRVTSRITFHFRDGSIDDERTVFNDVGPPAHGCQEVLRLQN